MPLNSLSPGYIKFHYVSSHSTGVLAHVLVVPVNIVTPDGDDTLITPKAAAALNWKDAAQGYIDILKPMLNNGGSAFTVVELFSQADAESAPFLEATDINTTAGTNAAATQRGAQQTLSMRSAGGGKARPNLLEGFLGPPRHEAYSAAASQVQAWADYLIGNNSIYYCRDNTYPVAMLFHSVKENDVLRRKRLGIG